MDYEKYIGVIEDFPKKGISFKDISPLLRDPKAFASCVDDLSRIAEEFHPTVIIGPESRAFVFGTAMAYKLGIGFVMARKAGKLPGKTYKVTYDLEYGTATLEIPVASFKKGDRVLIIDDLLATGGTFNALIKLVKEAGGEPVACETVIRLKELEGDKKIPIPTKYLLDL